MLVDTHAHLQFRDAYENRLDEVLQAAATEDVQKIVCVGVDENDSQQAIDLAARYGHVYATVGLHPHDAKLGDTAFRKLAELAGQPKVVAIGECGLDYYYNHSPKDQQEAAFRFQIELAQEHGLPMVWHVREAAETSSAQAFDDFFRIIDAYPGIKGIVHSFTGTRAVMDQVLERGLLIALNGIITFTKDAEQLEMAKAVPLNHLVLETDCPFLTPAPHRGKPNEPAYIKHTAEFLAELRGESLEKLTDQTSQNAVQLLNLA